MKTKPQRHFIGEKPASYVRLVSRVAGCYVPAKGVGRFNDSRGVPYELQADGSVRRVRAS